ncbi:pentapeptide repeat-containing protein [Thomasclavelia cocleata]|uniref:pentapeptide repeat-containing protein n=1 Tax=Thomasclavelia cocleata TaxID=69824 RepID=UPI00255A8DDD|nr:pentapeptide repeat-containing protein [Thomasclavelia cocleata]
MKRRKPVIYDLNECCFHEVEDNYYQCLFTENPLGLITVKDMTIEECKFVKIDFSLIKLINTHIVDCIFENCDLSNLEFNKISIHRCQFINCKMTGVNFINCSLHDLLFKGVQGRYLNISLGNIRNVDFIDTVLDESSFMEGDVKNLIFNQVSFIGGEIFKTGLKGMDFKTTNIEGIRIDNYSLKGVHVDMYQAIALASLLGIIVD